MVPAERGRVCAHQPGFFTPCSAWVWCEYVYFPHSVSGGSRGVGKPKLPGKPGGSTVCLWLAGWTWQFAGCRRAQRIGCSWLSFWKMQVNILLFIAMSEMGKTLLGCFACGGAARAR